LRIDECMGIPKKGWSKRQGYEPGDYAVRLGKRQCGLPRVPAGFSRSRPCARMARLPFADAAMPIPATIRTIATTPPLRLPRA